jgi:hypothetical protein
MMWCLIKRKDRFTFVLCLYPVQIGSIYEYMSYSYSGTNQTKKIYENGNTFTCVHNKKNNI